MRLSFFKKSDQPDNKIFWLDQKELHDLQTLAEQLNTSTASNAKQQAQHAGQLNSCILGSGSDYAESRPYQAGDDPRAINWRLSARSQETFVKTYFADSRPTLRILLDQRKSMIFGTRNYLKICQALRVALLLSNAGNIHGLDFKAWIINDHSLDFFDNTDDFLLNANKIELTRKKTTQGFSDTSLNNALKRIMPQLTTGSLFYLISDLTGVQKQQLSALAHHCVLQAIHILDPAEINLKNIGSLSLEDDQGTGLKLETQNEVQRLNFTTNSQTIIETRKKVIMDLNISYTRIMTNEDNIEAQIYLPIKSIT